jgi:hypothetical protein
LSRRNGKAGCALELARGVGADEGFANFARANELATMMAAMIAMHLVVFMFRVPPGIVVD